MKHKDNELPTRLTLLNSVNFLREQARLTL
jgi:hypothetical protein